MAAGTTTYMGLGVPLYGEHTQTQIVGATDIMTIKGANNQTGDFFDAVDSTGTKRFTVEDGGNVVVTQKAAADIGLALLRATAPSADAVRITANDGSVSANKAWRVTKNYNTLPRVYTTRPTTGLTKGEMLVLFHNSTPKIGICISTVGQQIKLIRLKTKTFGRLTA
jgi:hypothetical protein